MVSGSFVFIKTDNQGKTKKSDRTLIRKQCMNGRNLRIGVRSTYVVKSGLGGHHNGHEQEWSQSRRRVLDRPPAGGNIQGDDLRQADIYENLARFFVPRAPTSDLSVLADSMDPQARMHLCHYLTHAAHLIYPVELCVGFDLGQSNGIRWIFEDATYLHYILFFSSGINDVLLRRPYGKTTCYHLGRTIASLNDKLARSELDDSTIAVVSSLVLVCAVFADYNAAAAHFAGLQQIIRLRGGLRAFRHDLGLYIKLSRIDLAYTLHTGQQPLFAHEGYLSHAQLRTSPLHRDDDNDRDRNAFVDNYRTPPSDDSSPHLLGDLETLVTDRRVVSVFSDLQQLSNDLNHRRRLQDSNFKLAITSIQYRLLSLTNCLDDDISECLRLAMLVFLTTTYEIPESAGQRYPHLSDQFRESCCAVLDGGWRSELWNDFAMWILVIGGTSLYGTNEEWLRERWRRVVSLDETWDFSRPRLKRFLWIDSLHDKLGYEMYNTLNGHDLDEMALKRSRSGAWWLSGWGICPLEI